ncbi:hypothetical protein GWK47_053406 [Chionoecetes opilio]|uniref:Uncharacterized protein n=1 Tax=Chionoecetes opilio TaxID=41210 RepID=A0A8J5CR91_CHIOP|nr:hypothetical protein GWK47_053406 [Chionoecetes opilio]
MIVLFVVMVFFVFSYMLPLLREMEHRDALLLNATLRQVMLYCVSDCDNNASKFMSETLLQGLLLENATERQDQERQGKGAATPVEPDWSLVLGTFHHFKDENFEEFLIMAGLSFFLRALILNTSPAITFDRVFQGDDYYYDLTDDDFPDTKYVEVEGGGGGGGGVGEGEEERSAFQMVLTTSSVVTLTQRFRLGRPFTKQDYDGTPSKNTYVYRAATVLVHFKEKEVMNTTIIHTFDPAGLVTTIISGRNGMQARRHFRRAGGIV